MYPLDEWEHWGTGRSIELRATDVLSGDQREWTLPSLTEAERRERELDALEFGGAIEEYFGPHSLTSDYPMFVSIDHDRFLLSETRGGRRHCVQLGPNGEVVLRPELTPGLLWTLADDRDANGALVGLHVHGCATFESSEENALHHEFDDFELAPDPGWNEFELDGRELAECLCGSSFRAGDAWILSIRTWCAPRMTHLIPGSPGAPRGPYQETLVQLDAATGRVVRREVMDSSRPIFPAFTCWERRMWGTPDLLCGLSIDPRDPNGGAIGQWCFAVARPTKSGWNDERIVVADLPETYGYCFVGELEPGVALLRSSPLSEDLTADWVIVRPPAK